MSIAAVVTLTPAGAVDATYRVSALALGSFTRAEAYGREVSGKGVNLSAGLALAGVPTSAVVVLGEDDLPFATATDVAGILRPVPVPGATRVNTSIIDAHGATTKVNAPTPRLSVDAWSKAVATTLAEIAARETGWLVLCGTIPLLEDDSEPDVDALIAAVRARGVRVAVDTSGQALGRIVRGTSSVSLVKPNTWELAEVTGVNLTTVGEVTAAARSLLGAELETVYVSMGADGVLVVTDDTVMHARAQARQVSNTAGAGDASLAGFLAGLETFESSDRIGSLRQAAATAAAWGAHAVAQESTVLPNLTGLPESVVQIEPDPTQPLTEPARLI